MDAYELLNKDEMTILKKHYELVKDCTSKEQTEKMLKALGWTEKQKRFVLRLHNRLRSNGLFIVGQYPSGSLRFGVNGKSVSAMIMELSDEDFTAYRKGLLRIENGRICRTEAACR
ncbi:hypothetical protein [Desulfopila aestuarii]|uniref:Uncharacterized protein n=1 Tax=Desulfopila aestuarii DSM 18488 TaxID=1121416 RepID=A0A1M7YJU1_9BACT|nr:hypothetical protein [Desulfopila aestuarii]SHO52879.1 hypothetical protein SAMN02745220_04815 [Desulfopila aestuarii DSM 18488]